MKQRNKINARLIPLLSATIKLCLLLLRSYSTVIFCFILQFLKNPAHRWHFHPSEISLNQTMQTSRIPPLNLRETRSMFPTILLLNLRAQSRIISTNIGVASLVGTWSDRPFFKYLERRSIPAFISPNLPHARPPEGPGPLLSYSTRPWPFPGINAQPWWITLQFPFVLNEVLCVRPYDPFSVGEKWLRSGRNGVNEERSPASTVARVVLFKMKGVWFMRSRGSAGTTASFIIIVAWS